MRGWLAEQRVSKRSIKYVNKEVSKDLMGDIPGRVMGSNGVPCVRKEFLT